MQTDEQDILDYLKAWPGSFVSGKEIARKVGGKDRFEDDHGWALPILAQMVRHGLVESDHHGGYRLKPPEKKKREPQHVSPQLLKILKSSGKNFEGGEVDDGNNEPPIPSYRAPAAPEDGNKP
jgi:biotin operon repressor